MKAKKVQTERLILRNLSPSDAKVYSKVGVAYRSTGKINTEEKAKKHIKKSLNEKESFEWGLFLKSTGELIGIIEIDHLNWFDFKAGELSFIVRKKWQKQGFGFESSEALLNYCFKEMKLHKIYADTSPDNIGAQKLLKRLGFKLEGRIRERRKVKGKWVDELDYGLLKKEWKQTKH
jgi:ribosomal-protein-alanine N-acetyltransferase